MASSAAALCALTLILLGSFNGAVYANYVIPEPTITAFSPSGVTFDVPHASGLQRIAVALNVNRPLAPGQRGGGDWTGEARTPSGTLWSTHLSELTVRIGDVLHYRIAAMKDGAIVAGKPQRFTITHLTPVPSTESIVWPDFGGDGVALSVGGGGTPQQSVTPVRPAPQKPRPIAGGTGVRPQMQNATTTPTCPPSVTTVKGKSTCKGQLVFEEHFDQLDLTKWQFSVRIADAPDYEFCMYNKSADNTWVADGVLNLHPTLTSRVFSPTFVQSGMINLDDCTGDSSMECMTEATFGYILPPIISSCVRSAPFFSFRYGKVEIRAKPAVGDWLLSGIFLKPLRYAYGPRYDSGQIRLAMVRGNRDLQCNEQEAGLSQVEAGTILSIGEESMRRNLAAREHSRGWDNDYHIYKLEWLPDKLTFYVDNKVITTISPPDGGFGDDFDDVDRNPWQSGSKMAPFDKEFYLSLCLGAGGINDFPDDCISKGQPKPWRNLNPKAKLQFYRAQDSWSSTFSKNYQVDYVKVWAM